MDTREQFESETGLKEDRHSDVYESYELERKYTAWLESRAEKAEADADKPAELLRPFITLGVKFVGYNYAEARAALAAHEEGKNVQRL